MKKKKEMELLRYGTLVFFAAIGILSLVATAIKIPVEFYESIRTEAEDKGKQLFEHRLFNESLNCQPIPISNGNLTLNLIAIECIQQMNAGEG